MMPSQVLYLLNFFDIFGYNSGWSHLSKRRPLANFLYFIHFFSAAVFVVIGFRLITIYYLRLNLAEAISECQQYTVALYTYWSIIFDSFVYRQTHTKFWSIFERFSQQQIHFCGCCCCCCNHTTFNFTLRNYMRKLSLFGLKVFVTCAIRLGGYSMQKLEIDAPYVVLFTFCEIRMFYYLLCLEIVNGQLQLIGLKSKSIVNGLVCCNIEHACQQIKWIRQYFSSVYDMICTLNAIFGWSNVTAISFSFCFILTELNWYYVHFQTISPLNTFSTLDFAGFRTHFLLDNKYLIDFDQLSSVGQNNKRTKLSRIKTGQVLSQV